MITAEQARARIKELTTEELQFIEGLIENHTLNAIKYNSRKTHLSSFRFYDGEDYFRVGSPYEKRDDKFTESINSKKPRKEVIENILTNNGYTYEYERYRLIDGSYNVHLHAKF